MCLNGAITLSVITFVTNLQILILLISLDLEFEKVLGYRDQPGSAWDVFAFGYLWRLARQSFVAPRSIA